MIDLKKEVKLDGNFKEPQTISKIIFTDKTEVYYEQFITEYTEYIDPKDIEIQKLLDIIENLKEPVKKIRKRRKALDINEVKDIKVLLQLNTDVHEIAREYQSSTSAIYRIKKLLVEETIKNKNGITT